VEEQEQAIELYRGTATDLRAVNAQRLLGRVAHASGDLRQAREQAERALAIALESGDRWASECSDVLGEIAIVRGAWSEAAEHYGRALQIREPIGHANGIVEALVGLATVAELQGDWSEAERFARRAADVAQEMDACPDQAPPLRVLARLALRRGDIDTAGTYLDVALERCESRRPTIHEGPTRLILAELAERRGDRHTATRQVSTALDQGGTVEMLVEAHALRARLLVAEHEQSSARLHADRAHELAARTGAPRLVGLAALAAGIVAGHAGDLSRATRSFEAARRSFEGGALAYEVAVALREHGRLLHDAGQLIQGETLLAAARAGFEHLGAEADAVAPA
jgi:ATP/maltotriose-dependent transcriptional regulator MalT